MKKICFLVSHLGSGSNILALSLNENPRIQLFNMMIYSDMSSVLYLLNQNHKLHNNAAIYMEELVYNHQLQTKAVYDFCQFIYVVRPPTTTIPAIKELSYNSALKYYDGRLRRICEMAKRTGGVLLTWDDLLSGRCCNLLQDYLCLNEPIELGSFDTLQQGNCSIAELEKNYEFYISYLKKQRLQFC